jgi:hypothetical protein
VERKASLYQINSFHFTLDQCLITMYFPAWHSLAAWATIFFSAKNFPQFYFARKTRRDADK